MGNQVMREGIHRAIFTCLKSGYFRFGLTCPDKVSLRESSSMKADTYVGTLDFAASHSIEGGQEDAVEAGLEFDVTNGTMAIYRKKKSTGGQWKKAGTVTLRYRSAKYCWVGVSSPAHDGSFSVRRQSGNADKFPSQLWMI